MTEPQTPKNMVGIILRTGFGQDEWDLTLPLNVVVQALISRMTKEASLGLSALDSDGNRIPYRLMWQEGERYLAESETLGEAGVKDTHVQRKPNALYLRRRIVPPSPSIVSSDTRSLRGRVVSFASETGRSVYVFYG